MPGTYGYVEPSLVTFNTLISACGKAGKYPEALALWAKMRAARLAPDNFTVRALFSITLPLCGPFSTCQHACLSLPRPHCAGLTGSVERRPARMAAC